MTVEQVKDDLIHEYSVITDNFANPDRVGKVIDILREEGQYDANQILEGTMNFEQLIIQDGFIAVNFDLWLLLVKYKIPSIFISSRDIPETRFNLKEFVCYTSENTDKYAFILTPAMRKRKLNELPTYGLIVNKNKIDIQLSDIPRSEGLTNIENA